MPRIDNRRWPRLLAGALLVALYLLPRLTHLDTVVTSDEPIWLGRSANFYRALFQGDLADTFQFAHPGVPTMWTGMAGYWLAYPGYIADYTTNYELTFDIHRRIRAADLSELDVLVAARACKVLLQAVLFIVALAFCRRRFGDVTAALIGIAIALDPFLIAHDRLLHVDGLFAISAFAAVMALGNAGAAGYRATRPWIVAGVLAAIAWLTRSTGLVLGAVVAGWLLVDLLRHRGERPLREAIRLRLRPALIWGGTALVATVALWPALWVAPVSTLDFMIDWTVHAATHGHKLPTYFNGQIQHGDPGLLFYPVTMLWRLTPLTLLGLALFLGYLLAGAVRSRLSVDARRALALAAAFALLYGIGMSLGAKKFDRYILPVYPVVDLLAAVGIALAATALLRVTRAGRHAMAAAALAVMLVGQGGAWLGALGHPLDYFNPLLGGLPRAVHEVEVGWGEGKREAAAYILARADGEPVTVRVSGARGPLLYYLPPPIVVQPYDFESVADWETTDYYVAAIQQWQRHLDDDVIGYLARFDPAHVVRVDGVPLARVYDLSDIPPPPFLTEAAAAGDAASGNL